jgi:hypothetical protein
MTANQPDSSKWYIQYFDAFFTCLTGGYLLYNAAMFMPDKEAAFYSSHLGVGYRYLVLSATLCIIYAAIIHRREKEGKFHAEKAHAIFFGITRYWLACAICCYGFAKILGMQFRGADEIILRDSLLGDVSGNYLTWYYFNFSHPFMLIIGYLQIAGSLLLLFRRTTLAGIFVLLPVMVNIVMIDLFYGVPRTPTILAVVFTAALIYLLLLHSRQLAILFFKTVYPAPNVGKPRLKIVLRIAVVAFAFMSIYHEVLKYKDKPQPVTTALAGKWKVEPSFIGGKAILPHTRGSDPGGWGAIYFFGRGYCAISSNAYYYDRNTTNFGKYSLDTSGHFLRIYFLNTKDSLQAGINFINAHTILVKGLLGKDSVSMELTRVKI